MEINGAEILDNIAEAFPVWLSRVIITADTGEWAEKAAVVAAGFATSRIGCPCEAGIEGSFLPEETPDGRPGVSILICGEKKNMKSLVAARVSQCILPGCITSATDTRSGSRSAAGAAGRSLLWKVNMWGRRDSEP
jgi:formylmethanofuran--tetrahydromethanopterin N-formyltransferase